VTLTAAGRQLLEKAKALSSAASDFLEAARQTSEHHAQRIHLGIGWGLWDAANKVRVKFASRFPEVTIDATDAFCSETYNDHLRDRSLDVVFARPYFDSAALNAVPLFQEPILAVLSESHPLASRKSVRMSDLASEPLLQFDRHVMPLLFDKALELYARAKIKPTIIPTPGAGPYNHAGLMLAASGKGIYFSIGIPLSSFHPSASGVAVVPISDPEATIDICVAWRRSEASPMVLRFLDCVWQVFPQEERAPVAVRTPSRRAS
jgi:DNA-binding transcriptional LysR family regulator